MTLEETIERIDATSTTYNRYSPAECYDEGFRQAQKQKAFTEYERAYNLLSKIKLEDKSEGFQLGITRALLRLQREMNGAQKDTK